jgi:hypothetical protein
MTYTTPRAAIRSNKIFQRRGDLIHANYSLWSALITVNGIVLAVGTFAPTVSKWQIVSIIILCATSIGLLVSNFFRLWTNIRHEILYLDEKGRIEAGIQQKERINEKQHYHNVGTTRTETNPKFQKRIMIIPICLTVAALAVILASIINAR